MTLNISPRVQILSDIRALFQNKGIKLKHCGMEIDENRVMHTTGISYCGRKFRLHFNPTAIEEIN